MNSLTFMDVCLNNIMKYFDEKINEAHFSQLKKSYNFFLFSLFMNHMGNSFSSSVFTTWDHSYTFPLIFDYIQESVSLSWHKDKNKEKQLVWLHWEVSKSTDQPLQNLIVNIYTLLI